MHNVEPGSASSSRPRRDGRSVDLDSFARVVRRSQERARDLVGRLHTVGDPSSLVVATDEWLAAVDELEVAEEELRHQSEELASTAVTVLADREKLQQILLKLLTKAVKFTPAAGSVALSWDATADSVCIRVSDTGGGIRSADLERIFEPFVQGQVPRGARHGVGLGLAISRQLARLMNGDLAVISAVGEGATFTLRLPRHADA